MRAARLLTRAASHSRLLFGALLSVAAVFSAAILHSSTKILARAFAVPPAARPPRLFLLPPPRSPHHAAPQGSPGETGLRALQGRAATPVRAAAGGADVGAERLLGAPSGEAGFTSLNSYPMIPPKAAALLLIAPCCGPTASLAVPELAVGSLRLHTCTAVSLLVEPYVLLRRRILCRTKCAARDNLRRLFVWEGRVSSFSLPTAVSS